MMITRHLYHYTQSFYTAIFQPRAQDRDIRRREFILNVLLFGLFSIALLALFVTVCEFIMHQNKIGMQTIFVTAIFLGIISGCWRLVRAGYIRQISYLIVIVLLLTTTNLMLQWGFDLPQVLLAYVMTGVIAHILLGSQIGLLVTGLTALLVLLAGGAQTHNIVHPNLTWRHQAPLFADGVGYALVFSVIGLVSWLSNREIDASLERARLSEAALLAERDTLEIKVSERTKELERLQLVRIMELERFAAFGRISAALVHEVSNPLMAATINLQQFKGKNMQRLGQVNKNLQQIERQLEAARMQLRGGSIMSNFSIAHELRQVAELVKPVAQRHKMHIEFPKNVHAKLYGDVVKFNQIVSNLLMNAIEAYPPETPTSKRRVTINVHEQKNGIRLTVHDWGAGISSEDMQRIFEPFYSNKPIPEQHHGMGIGLGMIKQFVEHDYRGSLKVTSSIQQGTRFTVVLRSVVERADD